MPPVSEQQRRFMRWAVKNPKASGVPKKVSNEFNNADEGGSLPGRVKDGKPIPKPTRTSKWYDRK